MPADSAEYFGRIAELHIAEIHHGLLPRLGKKFLALLYQGLSGADRTGVWVALHDGHVLGFVAGCADTKRTMSEVLFSLGGKLLLAAAGAVMSLELLRNISAMLVYPFRQSPANGTRDIPKAELLAICVEPSSRGRSIGKQLVQALEKSFPTWGTIQDYHVKTNIEEATSNAFYSTLGFHPAGTVPHHRLVLQVYIKPISDAPVGVAHHLSNKH